MRSGIYILGCVLLSLGGCTVPQRTATLERQQHAMADEVVALRTKVTELEGKVAALTKRLGSVSSSKAAQRTLDERLKPVEDRLGSIERDQTDERRSGGAAATPAPPPAPVRAPVPTATAAAELDVDGLRRELARQLPSGYGRGLGHLRDGRYDEAIQAMREFVRAKHRSPFVGGALYWIGEAHMQLGQFYQAILAFTEVQQRWARSDWAPAAGYATGLAFLQLGNVSEARRAFEKVTTDYGSAPEAAKAASRLRTLEPHTP